MARRKQPNLREKLAATLLMMVRPDDSGKMVPVIPFEEAKKLTAAQIIGRFHFDHGVYATWGGPNSPWNLTPRLVPAHIEKTKRDVKNISKVRRAEKRKAGKSKPKKKIKSRSLPSKEDRRAWREQRGLA